MPAFLNYFLCCLLYGCTLFSLSAQNQVWSADWIGLPRLETDSIDPNVGKNLWLCYRKNWELVQKPEQSVKVRIACDSKYWFWINGELVVFEGQLKRGPTPNDTYYDEVEIGTYLNAGKNTLAILVWHWGRDGFNHKNSGRAGLLFEGQINAQKICSDTTWRVFKHPAYNMSSPPHPNFRLPEFNIHFDAQKDIPNWLKPDFADQHWPKAQTWGTAENKTWGKLWPRPIKMLKDLGLTSYLKVSTTTLGDTAIQYRAQLPKNLTITPYLDIEAPKGQKIDIRTDNYKGGSEYNVRTEYLSKSGRQKFETFGYMNGHEVIYTLPKTVKVRQLKYRETRFNTEYLGYFHSSDPALNALWIKAQNTLNVNLRDAIQDPDRERAQWWGDNVIIMGEMFYTCDTSSKAMLRKAMSNLVEWQKADGVLFSPIPAGNWDKELPAQMLASIGSYGFGKYFEYSNDSTMMRYLYPAVKKYLSLWQCDSLGLVLHRTGGWDWHDWGDRIDVPLLDNAWYYLALKAAAQMAFISKAPAEAEAYLQKAAKLKRAFNTQFWAGKILRSANYEGIADDRGNGLAVVAGLTTEEQWPKIKAFLDTTYISGPYLEKYILEAYFINQAPEAGLARMKKRYRAMIDSPITTLWEGWQVGSATYGGGTYNHGWSGGALTLLSQYVGGLVPATPGYGRYLILPQPAQLSHFKMGADTEKGFAYIHWKRESKNAELKVKTPQSMGQIGVPKVFPITTIKLNGRIIWSNGKPQPSVVKFVQETKQHLIFELGPGIYKFKIR
jgi:alpha-L-rhamnosidase